MQGGRKKLKAYLYVVFIRSRKAKGKRRSKKVKKVAR
jgi:hypothetical protein